MNSRQIAIGNTQILTPSISQSQIEETAIKNNYESENVRVRNQNTTVTNFHNQSQQSSVDERGSQLNSSIWSIKHKNVFALYQQEKEKYYSSNNSPRFLNVQDQNFFSQTNQQYGGGSYNLNLGLGANGNLQNSPKIQNFVFANRKDHNHEETVA